MSSFNNRIKALHKKDNVSQKDVALFVGRSEQSYSDYMTGREPSYDILCKIADYFGVSTDYILGRTDVKSPNMDIRAICQQTGLSQAVVQKLSKMSNTKDGSMEIVNLLLSGKFINEYAMSVLNIVACIVKEMSASNASNTIESIPAQPETPDAVKSVSNDSLKYRFFLCHELFTDITKRIYHHIVRKRTSGMPGIH